MEELEVPATQGLRSGRGAITPQQMFDVLFHAGLDIDYDDAIADDVLDGFEKAGFAIVPIEPSREMQEAGSDYTRRVTWPNACGAIYKAMIAAYKGSE